MSDVLKVVSKIMFYLLVAVLFVWTSSLTVSLASRLFPGDPILPWFALALFDVGALTWLLVFLKNAEGLAQRAVSILAFLLDLAGVCFASFAELFLGGQDLTAIPAGLGTYVVWAVGLYTIINLATAYVYHLTDPAEMQEIRMQTLRDNVKSEALAQVEAQITMQAQQLAGVLRDRIYTDTLASLRLPIPGADTIIEGKARDLPTPEPRRRNPVSAWLKPRRMVAFNSDTDQVQAEVNPAPKGGGAGQ